MQNPKTKHHFVEFDLDVNFWAQKLPDVRVARPPRCVECEAPGVSACGKIVLHGHGLRLRSPLGPSEAGWAPVVTLHLRACTPADPGTTLERVEPVDRRRGQAGSGLRYSRGLVGSPGR